MNVPSGDQTGLDDTESTSRTGAPPSDRDLEDANDRALAARRRRATCHPETTTPRRARRATRRGVARRFRRRTCSAASSVRRGARGSTRASVRRDRRRADDGACARASTARSRLRAREAPEAIGAAARREIEAASSRARTAAPRIARSAARCGARRCSAATLSAIGNGPQVRARVRDGRDQAPRLPGDVGARRDGDVVLDAGAHALATRSSRSIEYSHGPVPSSAVAV